MSGWLSNVETRLEYRFVVDDDNTIFEYRVDRHVYSFTVQGVDNPEWLARVVLSQVKDIRDRAFRLGADSVRQPIREALQILS